jgi:hypothetical protein
MVVPSFAVGANGFHGRGVEEQDSTPAGNRGFQATMLRSLSSRSLFILD